MVLVRRGPREVANQERRVVKVEPRDLRCAIHGRDLSSRGLRRRRIDEAVDSRERHRQQSIFQAAVGQLLASPAQARGSSSATTVPSPRITTIWVVQLYCAAALGLQILVYDA